MPCYDPPRPEDVSRENREHFRHNSDVAEILCTICKRMGNGWVAQFKDQDLIQWWREHQERDLKKAAQEKKEMARLLRRTEALSKLTPEERELLDLD